MKPELSYDLLELLPPVYREIGDYQQICAAEKAQFRQLAESIQLVQGNFFVQTMDEDSVSRWEQVFHIHASPSTETLEFRHQRILSRLRTRPPYTLSFLYEQLDALIGAGQWTCEIDYPAYALAIGASVEKRQCQNELMHLIHQIKPAHVVFHFFLFFKSVRLPVHLAASPSGLYCTMSARVRGKIPPQSGRVAALSGAAAAGVYAQTGAKLKLED